MLCLICFLFLLLCVPIIHPVSVRVDGMIEVEDNWGFKFTPQPEIGRMAYSSSTPSGLKNISQSDKTSNIYNSLESFLTERGARNYKLAKLMLPFPNIQMALVDDRNTQNALKNRHRVKKPFEEAMSKLQFFIADGLHDLYPNVKINPVESNSPTESYSTDILHEIRVFDPVKAKRSTIDVMATASEVTKHRVKKKKSRKVKPGFGYDITSSVRVTEPMDVEALHYILVTKKKKHKNHHNKSHKRNREITTTVTNKDGENSAINNREISTTATSISVKKADTRNENNNSKAAFNGGKMIEDTAKIKVRTSKSIPNMFTMILRQQAYDAGELYNPEQNISQRTEQKIQFVKNDERLQAFILDVFKQSAGLFNEIKSKTNNTKIKNKIDILSEMYRDKFANFVKDNQNQKVVTTLGTQKVVLNTIETSNQIMNRLLNFFISDMEKGKFVKDGKDISVFLRNQVENEEKQMYALACQKLKICRSRVTFSSFLADVVAILLQVNNEKLKQATDALTEVLKNTEHSKVMDKATHSKFQTYILAIEKADSNNVRTMLAMFRNMLVNKNKPLVVRESVSRSVVNQAVSMMDIIDLLDEKIPATDENISQWNDLKNKFKQWADGQRKDIVDIMQALVDIVLKSGIYKMDEKMTRTFRDKFKMILHATSFASITNDY